MENFDWDSWIKEATRYKPVAGIDVDLSEWELRHGENK